MRENDGARPELIRHTQPRHADVVLVDWMLGNSCNFACSYCPEALHDGSVRWQKPDAVIAFYDQLHRHYVVGMGRTVWLQFTGGEPTVYPGLMDILGAARARGFKVSLISNGSRTRRFWERLVERLDAAILTYHDEFVDHRAFLEIAGLASAQHPLNINVTAHPERFEAIVARAAELRAQVPNAWVTLKPLRRGFGSELYDYTPAQIEQMARWDPGGRPGPGTSPRGTMTVVMPDGTEFKRRANQFLVEGSNRWRGYSCAAGLEFAAGDRSGQDLPRRMWLGRHPRAPRRDHRAPDGSDPLRPRQLRLRRRHPDHEAPDARVERARRRSTIIAGLPLPRAPGPGGSRRRRRRDG